VFARFVDPAVVVEPHSVVFIVAIALVIFVLDNIIFLGTYPVSIPALVDIKIVDIDLVLLSIVHPISITLQFTIFLLITLFLPFLVDIVLVIVLVGKFARIILEILVILALALDILEQAIEATVIQVITTIVQRFDRIWILQKVEITFAESVSAIQSIYGIVRK
jgi:hypothetical protein